MGSDSAAADVAARAGVSNTNMCSSSSACHQLEQLGSTSAYAAACGHIRCSQCCLVSGWLLFMPQVQPQFMAAANLTAIVSLSDGHYWLLTQPPSAARNSKCFFWFAALQVQSQFMAAADFSAHVEPTWRLVCAVVSVLIRFESLSACLL
jgi:hypothetical protein